MEYALGLTIVALGTFAAIWINDNFAFGGELPDESQQQLQH